MWYVVPAVAATVTRLRRSTEPLMSSLDATGVSAATDTPVYTPRVVSNSLPRVLMYIVPLLGAVNRHHWDPPPALLAWLGSLVSLVAKVLAVGMVSTGQTGALRALKFSLLGWPTTLSI